MTIKVVFVFYKTLELYFMNKKLFLEAYLAAGSLTLISEDFDDMIRGCENEKWKKSNVHFHYFQKFKLTCGKESARAKKGWAEGWQTKDKPVNSSDKSWKEKVDNLGIRIRHVFYV